MTPLTHQVRVGMLVAALVAAAGIAGCSAQKKPGPDATGHAGKRPSPTRAAATAGASSMPSPQPLSAWPAKPFTDSSTFHWDDKPQTIAAGYSAADFRVRMQKAWHLSAGATRPGRTFAGRQYRIFADKLTTGGHLLAQVSGTEDAQGNLQQLECDVYADAPRPADFLKDCASVDYPHADPARAAAWEETYRPQLDRMLKSHVAWVESPLFTAGGSSMYLRHHHPTTTADGARLVDQLVVFGTGASDSG